MFEECGDMETIILDETIKEYSCYKRLSHFKKFESISSQRIN